MANEISNTPIPGQQPQTIPLSKIHDLPGVFNPKPVESKLGSMILSIQNNGVMEPVILRDRGDGQYQLLSGYRRRVASERAGKKDIPAFVYEMTMQEAIAYRKAVKDNPKAPIPGKLVDPAKSRDGEKPDMTEGKENGQMKIGAVDGQDKPADKDKDGEKPIEAVKDADAANKDGKAKDGKAPAAPSDKEQVNAGKDKQPDQPNAADKGKDNEKPAEAVKDADAAVKDGKAKDGEAPAALGDKEQTDAGKDKKPDQPDAADKDGEKPAENKVEAEHKPTVAELEAKAKAGEPINLSELADAQKREREAAKDDPAADKGKDQKQSNGRSRPKSTLRPTDTEAEKLKKGAAEKEADAPALETAVKGSASTAIKQVLEDRLDPPGKDALKSIPVPGDGESIFVTLHPAYLEKSPLNTFSVDTESENFKELCKSIELVGIKDPVLARFNAEGKLEILSGQRRHFAATTLNRAVPTIIQKIDDADAKILVADGNLHRDKISSYDLSRALRMKMEGMKQKAGRRKKGYAAAELQSDAKLAQEMGMSVPKLNRYIHLSEAVKGVCDLVDDGKLTISVASEIAYLKKGTQESIMHLMDLGYKPTNERIQRIKRAENSGKKPDEMMLRSILDDKDIAPKQPPQTPQQPSTETQQPSTATQAAPAVEVSQPSSAPAPETIPASPDVSTQTPGGMDAPAHAEQPTTEQKPETPTDGAKPDNADDITKGPQERPEETKIVLKGDRLRKYFPDVNMTPREIEESVYAALEERRQRQLRQQQKPQLLKR
ncbi:MAG: ParB N-terminal domain-containing protein [Clostridia bacterium]|nr:ParB N-terminal domain-containing protein [Clostridia bacterium]